MLGGYALVHAWTGDRVAALLAGLPEVDPARVVYLGESLGAAVALRRATSISTGSFSNRSARADSARACSVLGRSEAT